MHSRQEGIREVAEELPVRLQLQRNNERREEVESVLRLDTSVTAQRDSMRWTDLEEGATSLRRLHHVRRRGRHGRVLLCRHDQE